MRPYQNPHGLCGPVGVSRPVPTTRIVVTLHTKSTSPCALLLISPTEIFGVFPGQYLLKAYMSNTVIIKGRFGWNVLE